MQSDLEARETLSALGVSQACVARLFGVEPRAIRKWRRGDRPIPHGVGIVLQLLASGAVNLDQVEQAAAQAGGVDSGSASTVEIPADPDPLALAVIPVDPDSIAAKIVALRLGDCRWPVGSIDDPAGFRFCCAPATAGSYCAAHHAMSRRPWIPTALYRRIRDHGDHESHARFAPVVAVESEREDHAILTTARERHEVALELAS
jgi:hypothetical protein